MDFAGRRFDRVHKAAFGVHTDMGFYAKMRLIALFGLAHVRVTLACPIFGRRQSRDQ